MTTEEMRLMILDLIHSLIDDRRKLPPPLEVALRLCQQDPEFAAAEIKKRHDPLVAENGRLHLEIGTLAREVELSLRGGGPYLKDYFVGNQQEQNFVAKQLQSSFPFTQSDLRFIRDNSIGNLRALASRKLGGHAVTFGERLVAEPLGLSMDMESLKKSITDYGFTPDLNSILEKIDTELAASGDPFDQTATMKHIRSFFEKLHESLGKELQAKKPRVGNGTPLGKCGQAIDYLQRKKVVTEKIAELARCLYAILSDGAFGVHALKAERDYTRLCRNIVVEYSVTLMLELERRLAQPGDT